MVTFVWGSVLDQSPNGLLFMHLSSHPASPLLDQAVCHRACRRASHRACRPSSLAVSRRASHLVSRRVCRVNRLRLIPLKDVTTLGRIADGVFSILGLVPVTAQLEFVWITTNSVTIHAARPSIPIHGPAAHQAGIALGTQVRRISTVYLKCISPITLRSTARAKNAVTHTTKVLLLVLKIVRHQWNPSRGQSIFLALNPGHVRLPPPRQMISGEPRQAIR